MYKTKKRCLYFKNKNGLSYKKIKVNKASWYNNKLFKKEHPYSNYLKLNPQRYNKIFYINNTLYKYKNRPLNNLNWEKKQNVEKVLSDHYLVYTTIDIIDGPDYIKNLSNNNKKITIGSFNIQHLIGLSENIYDKNDLKSYFIRALNGKSIDFLGLQELSNKYCIDNINSILLEIKKEKNINYKLYYNKITNKNADTFSSGTTTGIIYNNDKWKLDINNCGSIKRTIKYPKGAIYGLFILKEQPKVNFMFLNIHLISFITNIKSYLKNFKSARNFELKKYISKLSNYDNLILVGDFNTSNDILC